MMVRGELGEGVSPPTMQVLGLELQVVRSGGPQDPGHPMSLHGQPLHRPSTADPTPSLLFPVYFEKGSP